MISSVFLDTSGWIALLNAADAQHGKARQIWRDIVIGKREIVVTDWIVAETGNGLARFHAKARLVDAIDRIVKNSRGHLIYIDDELLRRALERYAQYADKQWGLVDCASFIVMQDRGISEAFTSDQHFEQAGFNCLLDA
jgi:predicted nucleic acid-binding protein